MIMTSPWTSLKCPMIFPTHLVRLLLVRQTILVLLMFHSLWKFPKMMASPSESGQMSPVMTTALEAVMIRDRALTAVA
jgi:hypothetical protein